MPLRPTGGFGRLSSPLWGRSDRVEDVLSVRPSLALLNGHRRGVYEGIPPPGGEKTVGLPVEQATVWEVLPHAVPFLFVDRVISVEQDGARVLRGVTRNDALLHGHATLPPTLMVEALAQAAGILLASCKRGLKAGLLTAVDDFVFRGAVRNGDRVILEVKLQRVRAPFFVVRGRALVGEEVRAEGNLTLWSEPPWRSPGETRSRGGQSPPAGSEA
jgi:3-hydroxymyristoyl/3-hydroxydecanoyl-(acyl carrier protein) dehydratase